MGAESGVFRPGFGVLGPGSWVQASGSGSVTWVQAAVLGPTAGARRPRAEAGPRGWAPRGGPQARRPLRSAGRLAGPREQRAAGSAAGCAVRPSLRKNVVFAPFRETLKLGLGSHTKKGDSEMGKLRPWKFGGFMAETDVPEDRNGATLGPFLSTGKWEVAPLRALPRFPRRRCEARVRGGCRLADRRPGRGSLRPHPLGSCSPAAAPPSFHPAPQ